MIFGKKKSDTDTMTKKNAGRKDIVKVHEKTDTPVLSFSELDVQFKTEFGRVHAVRGQRARAVEQAHGHLDRGQRGVDRHQHHRHAGGLIFRHIKNALLIASRSRLMAYNEAARAARQVIFGARAGGLGC